MRREELRQFNNDEGKFCFFRLTFAKSWYIAKSCKILHIHRKLYKALSGLGDFFSY